MGNFFVTEKHIDETITELMCNIRYLLQRRVVNSQSECKQMDWSNRKKCNYDPGFKKCKEYIDQLVAKSPKYLGHMYTADTLFTRLINLFVEFKVKNDYSCDFACIGIKDILKHVSYLHYDYDPPGSYFKSLIKPTGDNKHIKSQEYSKEIQIKATETTDLITVTFRMIFLMNDDSFSIDSVDVLNEDGKVIEFVKKEESNLTSRTGILTLGEVKDIIANCVEDNKSVTFGKNNYEPIRAVSTSSDADTVLTGKCYRTNSAEAFDDNIVTL